MYIIIHLLQLKMKLKKNYENFKKNNFKYCKKIEMDNENTHM